MIVMAATKQTFSNVDTERESKIPTPPRVTSCLACLVSCEKETLIFNTEKVKGKQKGNENKRPISNSQTVKTIH